jgi:hypothetical protein
MITQTTSGINDSVRHKAALSKAAEHSSDIPIARDKNEIYHVDEPKELRNTAEEYRCIREVQVCVYRRHCLAEEMAVNYSNVCANVTLIVAFRNSQLEVNRKTLFFALTLEGHSLSASSSLPSLPDTQPPTSTADSKTLHPELRRVTLLEIH